MGSTYFKDLGKRYGNRFWINNPTVDEMEKAINVGAIACTTNPAFCSRLAKVGKDGLRATILAVLEKEPDIERAAPLVYAESCRPLLARFRALYDSSGGKEGFVTIQDDPRRDADAAATMKAVEAYRRLGPNFMAKIPVVPGGIEAIEACVAENVPICATEIFAVSQAMEVCEAYESASAKTGKRPPLYVTHISGIFDDYLRILATRQKPGARPEALAAAGILVARKQYRLMQKKFPGAILLGGGARNASHFTGLAGGEVDVTINWSTAEDLMKSEGIPEAALNDAPDTATVAALEAAFTDFTAAWNERGLPRGGFAEYGPVQLFRNQFLEGWYALLSEIASVKREHAL